MTSQHGRKRRIPGVVVANAEVRERPPGQGCPARFDDARGIWVVDDPELVRHVLRNPDMFPPDNALLAYTPLTRDSLRALSAARFALPQVLASASGQLHRQVRRTVARFLSQRRVDGVGPLIRELTRARLPDLESALASDGTADLVEVVSGMVPAGAAFALFGLGEVPAELKRWSQDSLELFWGTPNDERQLVIAHSAADYYRWLRTQVNRARADPGEDLFSALVGLGLDDERVCAAMYFLLIAGQETTSMLIATVFLRLLTRPGAWVQAAADAEFVTAEVEAALREESSVPTWRRTTRAPELLDGTGLPAKADLLLTLSGIGSDADLAFGVGIHRCLGAGLARLEARLAVETVVAAFPRLTLAEPDPPRVSLLSFAAPARVLVRR